MDPGERRRRLDLDAPLLSVRRSPAAPAAAAGWKRPPLPYYKSELTSGPVRHPGVVPFVWEQRPGQPKPGASVRTRRPLSRPPAMMQRPDPPAERDPDLAGDAGSRDDEVSVVASNAEEEQQPEVEAAAVASSPAELTPSSAEEDEFVDALDTLSRTESFAMACSVSEMPLEAAATSHKGAADDSEAREFMMGRFLPAAQAMAAGSPQYNFRKASNAAAAVPSEPVVRQSLATGPQREAVRLPQQHLPPGYPSMRSDVIENMTGNHSTSECDFEDEDDDEEDAQGFMAKGCGLLPKLCMKTSVLLMNPVPGMRPQSRIGSPSWVPRQQHGQPLARSSRNAGPCGDPIQNSWEEVYRHKMSQKLQIKEDERRSKITSDSNLLANCGDSQTTDGRVSSASHGSNCAGISNHVTREKPNRMIDFLDSQLRSSKLSSHKESSTMNGLALIRGGDGDCDSSFNVKASDRVFSSTTRETTSSSEYCSVLGEEESPRRDAGNMDPCQDNSSLHLTSSEFGDLDLAAFTRSSDGNMLVNVKNHNQAVTDDPLSELDVGEPDLKALPSFLPPPLPMPKTPSESWLSRTLPSVTRKTPARPFLGMRSQPKKQVSWALDDQTKENQFKLPTSQKTRFAEVLEKPAQLIREI